HFNFPKITKYAFTLKTTAKIQMDDPEKVYLFYDNKMFPGFFAWLIPHNEEQAEIGLGTTQSSKLMQGFEFLLDKIKPSCHGPISGRVIPLVPRKKTAGVFNQKNVLLVGDAAGQVKSSSGGGVVFGTSSARIAGALVESPWDYETAWRKENEADILAHVFLRNFFSLQPNELLKLTGVSSNIIGLNRIFSLYGNMDRPIKTMKSVFSNPIPIIRSITNI
ncbi:NAD(P)/FAD-dependent oxidoreductase, partial [Candidatus Micrarchaeota archaeon]|nr:NAD(P)/FAD-dependent oxidoreductase [Candidatus Micrarchaeota archaeon]